MTIRAYRGALPQLGQSVYVDETALIIGKVTLGDHVSIWPMTVVRGDVHHITVGEGTNIQDGCVLHVTHAGEWSEEGHPLIIGRHVTVGHKVVLHGCTVGDHCLIGMSSTLMDGAVVEDEVMIGAGSLVTPGKRLQSGYLYVGAPARQIRPLKAEEKALLRYSAQQYVLLKNDYLNARP